MNKPPDPMPRPADRAAHAPPDRVVEAARLLRGARELWIEHKGERYRLSLTRNEKLILTK
ncbi:MAG: hemin uptake protein HemP [Thiobacillaceae bacterium]|jgi:hemin uptake protein HemP|nr:hemin uptake protein HemP [Thiobacillaceae bacterium]